MLNGSCLCGAVAYEAEATVERIVHCHCQTCRKTHGTAFSSVTAVPRDRFKWTKGAELLGAIESSPGKFRRFCSTCGSHIMAERTAQPVVLLRLGCLDTPIMDVPQVHIWRSDSAPWYDPKVALPEKAEGFQSVSGWDVISPTGNRLIMTALFARDEAEDDSIPVENAQLAKQNGRDLGVPAASSATVFTALWSFRWWWST